MPPSLLHLLTHSVKIQKSCHGNRRTKLAQLSESTIPGWEQHTHGNMSTQQILIVDDHPLYRQGMVAALSVHLPEAVLAEADTAEAGFAALQANPDFDLVLIDLRLPGMDGFEALALYARHFPTVARVIISGQDDPAYARRAMQTGAAGFISKSLAVTEAVAAIRRVLAGEVFLPENTRQSQGQNTACPALTGLTLRELEVLRLLGEGYTNQQIATALEFTERTAKAHIAAIFETLKADNRTQAVVIAQRLGYLAVIPERI